MEVRVVPFVPQRSYWDCGLACIEMVLQFLNRKHCSFEVLREKIATESIWTIDLAYLLKNFEVEFIFATTSFGIEWRILN